MKPFLIPAFLLVFIANVFAQTPTHLRCEHRIDPVGIGTQTPRLSWVQPFARQQAWQIRSAADSNDLKAGKRLRWDSGKRPGDRNVLVAYGGPVLQPGERTYWQVRVWDAQGKASGWSAPAFWETGRTDLGAAQWITAPWPEDSSKSQPCPMFRRTLPSKARWPARVCTPRRTACTRSNSTTPG